MCLRLIDVQMDSVRYTYVFGHPIYEAEATSYLFPLSKLAWLLVVSRIAPFFMDLPDCGVNSLSQACEKVIAIVSKNDNLICSLDKLQKLPAKYNKGSHCFLRKWPF